MNYDVSPKCVEFEPAGPVAFFGVCGVHQQVEG